MTIDLSKLSYIRVHLGNGSSMGATSAFRGAILTIVEIGGGFTC